jgi:hypothetical protein
MSTLHDPSEWLNGLGRLMDALTLHYGQHFCDRGLQAWMKK